jgi:SAM-dependent methyltransferase
VNRFEEAYRGTPPWDIGRAQPAVERLARGGAFPGSVLDAGCGTGENTLLLAALGAEAWGLDQVPAAVERAREAFRRGWAVRSIERERFQSHLHPDGARAWLARIERLPGSPE